MTDTSRVTRSRKPVTKPKTAKRRRDEIALKRAGVPWSCWDISALKTGREYLRTTARQLNAAEPDGTLRPGIFVWSSENVRRSRESLYLAAKEFVIAERPTLCISFAMLSLRINAWARRDGLEENDHMLAPLFGVGMIAVYGMPPFEWVSNDQREDEISKVQAWLQEHLHHGGYLAIEGDAPLEGRNCVRWSGEFVETLLSYCTQYEV